MDLRRGGLLKVAANDTVWVRYFFSLRSPPLFFLFYILTLLNERQGKNGQVDHRVDHSDFYAFSVIWPPLFLFKWQPSWKPASHCQIIHYHIPHTQNGTNRALFNEKFRGRKKTEPPPSCPFLFFTLEKRPVAASCVKENRPRTPSVHTRQGVPPGPPGPGVGSLFAPLATVSAPRSRLGPAFKSPPEPAE